MRNLHPQPWTREARVGDVFKHEETAEIILVGDVNALGGVCDDCPCDIWRYSAVAKRDLLSPGWSYQGNILDDEPLD